MIRNSFILLERISELSEKKIWQQGIHDWNSFISSDSVKGISPVRKRYYDNKLSEAKKHLLDQDSKYFSGVLPVSEMWRLYDTFSDDCVFLDIETTGYYGDITVLGMYDGRDTMTLVKHRNLTKENVKDILKRYKMIVTFNGLSFDVPVINRYFDGVVPSVPHLDLRFPLKKLGFTGGLKQIEESVGIKRSAATTGLRGEDAIHLWQEYMSTGDADALDLLVEYNTEDVLNLKPLANFVFSSMKRRLSENFR